MLTPLIVQAALALNSSAWVPNGVLLRYKFHPGESLQYSMAMNMNMESAGQPFNWDMNMVIRQKVNSVARDGTATISVQMLRQTMNMGGREMPMSSKTTKPSTMKLSPTGHVSGLTGQGAMGGPMGLSGLQTANILPDRPVSVGTHWKSSASTMGGQVELNNTVTALSKKGGHLLATIRSGGDVDMGKVSAMAGGAAAGMKGKMNISMNYVFDATAGLVKSMEGNMTMNMNAAGHDMKGHATMHMHLQG